MREIVVLNVRTGELRRFATGFVAEPHDENTSARECTYVIPRDALRSVAGQGVVRQERAGESTYYQLGEWRTLTAAELKDIGLSEEP